MHHYWSALNIFHILHPVRGFAGHPRSSHRQTFARTETAGYWGPGCPARDIHGYLICCGTALQPLHQPSNANRALWSRARDNKWNWSACHLKNKLFALCSACCADEQYHVINCAHIFGEICSASNLLLWYCCETKIIRSSKTHSPLVWDQVWLSQD